MKEGDSQSRESKRSENYGNKTPVPDSDTTNPVSPLILNARKLQNQRTFNNEDLIEGEPKEANTLKTEIQEGVREPYNIPKPLF